VALIRGDDVEDHRGDRAVNDTAEEGDQNTT
jgi:hypothetical protein